MIKRGIITILMLLVVGLTAGAFDFSAQAPTGQTLYFAITSSNTVKVTYPAYAWTSYDKPTGMLTIPSTVVYSGVTYNVTEIGTNAFNGCDSMTAVIIQEGIHDISTLAFFQCSMLDTIVLPSSLTNIAITVFNSTAYVSNPAHWEDSLFLYCGDYLLSVRNKAKGSIVLRDGIQGIAGLAVYNCDSIHNVTIPASLRFISARAFDDCTGLDTIHMLSEVPPMLSYDVFEQGYDMVVVVPCGSLAAYQAAENWSNYNIVECPCDTNHNDSVSIVPVNPVDSVPLSATELYRPIEVTAVPGGIMIKDVAGTEVGVFDVTGHRVAVVNINSDNQVVALPALGVYIVVAKGRKATKVVYLQ